MGGVAGAWRPRDSELGKALRGASLCPWGGACRASPKNNAQRSGGQRPYWHRDGRAIALVGDAGTWCQWDSEWGEALRRTSWHPRGGACRSPTKNSAHRSGHQKAHRSGHQKVHGSPRRVYYSLGGGRRGVAFVGLELERGFLRAFLRLGGGACRAPPKNSARRSASRRP